MSDQPKTAPTGLTGIDASVLERIYATIERRRHAEPSQSYTAKLFSRGPRKIAQKLGEEAVEAVIETIAGRKDALVQESADLLFHLLVAWSCVGVRPEEVWEELTRREGVSGVAEKASRPAD